MGNLTDVLTARSYAKVNITLDVLRHREDGYHEVKMIMQTVDLYDKIYIKKQKQGIGCSITCFISNAS